LVCEEHVTATPEESALTMQIVKTITEDQESFHKEYNRIQSELKELNSDEVINAYFKRA
jgi:hypothetical protein